MNQGPVSSADSSHVSTTRQPVVGSFTLRLVLMVLVPLVGLGVLALQRVEREERVRDTARELVDDARLQQDVAAVYGPAQFQQIGLQGLSRVDQLGVPRDLVVSISGVDFQKIDAANIDELDRALDRLVIGREDRDVGGGPLGERVAALRVRIEEQRALADALVADPEQIRVLFDDLDALLAESVADATAVGPEAFRTGTTSTGRMQMAALSDVLTTAGQRGETLLEALLGREPDQIFQVVVADTRLDAAVVAFREVLGPDQQLLLDQLTTELRSLPPGLLTTGETLAADGVVQEDFVENATGAILDQISFLDALEAYSAQFHDDVVDRLELQAAAAGRAVRTTVLFVAVTLVICLVALLLITLTTLRPLRRLTRRASEIGQGAFDAEPLTPRGPDDVRTLTTTMNEMMITLHHVERELIGLAEGSTRPTGDDLPGEIGVTLRRTFSLLRDTTDRLHASRQLAAAIVQQAADAIWTIDVHGVVLSANTASADLLGIDAHSQIGRPLGSFISAVEGEIDVVNASGETARLLVANSHILSGGEQVTAVIARDISERTRYENRLSYQAHHDALTGLPNRYFLLEALGSRPPMAPVALMFVDLDGFKSVNDSQGHVAGDRLLTEVGARLAEIVPRSDLVGRLGGDEFVVVVDSFDDETDVVERANHLIDRIEHPAGDTDGSSALSASVGVAVFADGLGPEGLSPLEAIRCADSAVYEAKRKGRGRVEVFDARLRASIVNDAEIEMALRSAIRDGELEIHLQPVMNLDTGRFDAAEALVRWNRPGHGLVPPGAFIPIAERTSLIVDIGRWVLNQACETLVRWRQVAPDVRCRIAVNIAGSHLLDGHLVADLDAALRRTGADPTLLEIELTETQLMSDVEAARAVLSQIRRRGVTVAIDDFGTGYSSMAYLRQLPIDVLKIDRSFVDDLTGDDADSTVVDALLSIGHALGLHVVAEGIENAEQLEHLRRSGCDRAQGFHLARPTPVAQAEALIHGTAASALVST